MSARETAAVTQDISLTSFLPFHLGLSVKYLDNYLFIPPREKQRDSYAPKPLVYITQTMHYINANTEGIPAILKEGIFTS